MNLDLNSSPSSDRAVFVGTVDDGSYLTFSDDFVVAADRLEVQHSPILTASSGERCDEDMSIESFSDNHALVSSVSVPSTDSFHEDHSTVSSVSVPSADTFLEDHRALSSIVVPFQDNSLVVPDGSQTTTGDCDDICWLGATFDSLDSADKFFKDYSVSRGYRVFRNRSRKCRVGDIVYHKEFKCSYAGVSRRKVGGSDGNDLSVPNEVRERRRVDKKSNCSAMICCKLVSEGCWVVVTHKREHSHCFVVPEQRFLLRSGKYVNKELFEAIFDLMRSGVRASEAMRILGNNVGGIEALGVTKRMVYNRSTAKKQATLDCGDAMLLLQTFRERVEKEPNFFFEILVDEESRMSSFLWCDEVMRSDYAVFGDVVVFDTTFRTNKYNMFCAPFVGIDNHKQNLVFSVAFLVGQKKEDFAWCFQCFLRAMNRKMPQTVMTDQDSAIAHAVDHVLLGVQHRLCLWHICENAKKNLKGLMHVDGFSKMFYKCLYYCETPEDFELQWQKMISAFGQGSNTWLSNLYSLRNKWSPVLCRHMFSAGIRSSQRSESTNSVLTSLANSQMGMYAVFIAVEKMVNEWRNKRIAEDFLNDGVVNLKTKESKLLIDASKIYTRAILEDFEVELVKGAFGKFRLVEGNLDFLTYEVSSGLSDRHKFLVKYELPSGSVSCSCMFFQERGILCFHAQRVLNILHVEVVPRDSILHRWTKEARLVYDKDGKYICQDAFSCLAWRNLIMNRYLNVVLASQRDEQCRSILEKSMSALEKNLRAVKIGSTSSSTSISSSSVVEDVQLGNPEFVSSNIYRSKHGKNGRGRSGGCGQGRGRGRGQAVNLPID